MTILITGFIFLNKGYEMKNKLENSRININNIDKEMADLFVARMKEVRNVAQYKQENGIPVFDSQRELEIIERNSQYIDDVTLRSYYVNFLKNKMELSKSYQHHILEGMKISYSGVEGSFAQIASSRIFPDGQHLNYPNFHSAYQSVVDGDCDCVVLPIENSTNGDVTNVIDLAFEGSLFINGIYSFSINHCLLVNKGVSYKNLKKVISHPQALAQCRDYLKDKDWQEIEAINTAVAGKQLSESLAKDAAVIASSETAKLYNLEVLERNINQSSTNTTRFAVFSRTSNQLNKNDDRFFMFFIVKNKAGSLSKAVSIIGNNGFNLQALKSRPTKDNNWEYYFIIEGIGNINGKKGAKMLKELDKECLSVKVIGSYINKPILESGE